MSKVFLFIRLLLVLCNHFVFLIAQENNYVPSCHDFMNLQEIGRDIPANLLMAISNVESGRDINDQTVPWPWTINVEGKGYVFKSKAEAIMAVKKFRQNGITNIDVGIMQINLMHHPDAFANLNEAFDPCLNIMYAAKFLKELFLKHKNWQKAIGYYHSSSPKYYKIYRKKVTEQWNLLRKHKKNITSKNIQPTCTGLHFDAVDSVNYSLKKSNVCVNKELRSFARAKKTSYTLGGGTNNMINKPNAPASAAVTSTNND